MTEWSRSSRII